MDEAREAVRRREGYVFVPMDSDRFAVPFVPCARCGEGAAHLVHAARLPETFDHAFE